MQDIRNEYLRRLKLGEHIKLGACGGEFIVCETVDNNTSSNSRSGAGSRNVQEDTRERGTRWKLKN